MKSAEKPVPPTTVENAVPPNEEYSYFEGRREHPFRHASGELEAVNAWWLAEASLLAYAEPPFAVPRFESAGFPEVEFFSGESTQCFAASNGDFTLVAFSGTELRRREGRDDIRNIVADWLVNLDFSLTEWERGGRVHRGFEEALDEVWGGLGPHLDEVGRDRAVWFTGHSLGAALATLAAERYGETPALYTFGSPRVGDGAFGDGFPFRAYRFVNDCDIVPRMPPPGVYRHVGEAEYIDEKGFIHEGARLLWSLDRRLADVLDPSGRLLAGGVRSLPDNCLTDHGPIYYAVHIWNWHVRELRG